MFIPAPELAELVSRTLPGAAPLERAHLTTTFHTIERTNVTARLDSPLSRFLRNLTDKHLHFFTPEAAALLSDSDLFGVALSAVNAIPRERDGRRQVIVFDGLLQVVRYYADLITLLNLLLQHRPDATIELDGAPEREALAFSSAAFAALAGFIDHGRPLPAIRSLLGRQARKDAAIGYLFAVLFILAHELGHLHLGHLAHSPLLSERIPVSFAVPETLNRLQANELEADGFAFTAFREQSREHVIPSVLFFLGPFAFLEAFAQVAPNYPLSLNRAEHVRSLIAPDSETAQAAGEVLQSSIAGFHRLATLRGGSGEELRRGIHAHMPTERASRVIREVTERIRVSGVSMDAEG